MAYSAYINRGRVEIGLTVIGALGMPVVFIGLFVVDPLTRIFDGLCLLGFFASFLFPSMDTYRIKLQRMGACIGRIEFLTQLLGIVLVLVHSFFSNVLALSAKEELLVIFFPLYWHGTDEVFGGFFRVIFHILLKIFYRIKIEGMENFQPSMDVF